MAQRPIPGYPGYSIDTEGIVYGRRDQPIGAWPDPRGYPTLYLNVDGTRRQVRVHQLMALAFLGPRPEGLEIRHLDDNKLNNRLSNLRYGTHSENALDMYRNGLGADNNGERNGMAKLTFETVRQLRSDAAAGDNYRVLAERYGITQLQAGRIVRRQAWKVA